MTVSFNKAQLSASLHSDGPMLVLAGPGSGKTTVIVQRIQNLIHRFHVPPAEILVVTFSRAAAQEMQARFIRAEEQTANTAHPVSKETSKNKNPSHTGASVNFGTLHSVFFGILKDELHYSSDNILRPSLKTAIIRTELEKHAFPTEDLPQGRP